MIIETFLIELIETHTLNFANWANWANWNPHLKKKKNANWNLQTNDYWRDEVAY